MAAVAPFACSLLGQAPCLAAESERQELPANPRLVEPIPPAPDPVTESTPAGDTPPKLRLGMNAGVLSRAAQSEVATYHPGFTWGGQVGVVLLPWLAARATAQVTSQSVGVHDGAWGLSNPGEAPPHLRELALAGALEVRQPLSSQLDVYGGVGIAWARLSMSKFLLEQPWPAAVETRSGVTLQLPLHAGVRYGLGRPAEALELSLIAEFRYAPAFKTSGEYFDPAPGQDESVRSDTGTRVQIGGMPGVGPSRIVVLGIEAALF